MKLTLYYSPGACSLAPHITLNEAGVPFTPHKISLMDKEQQTPTYLAINPRGRVPALAIDGFILTEAVAILSWIGKHAGNKGIYPSDPLKEARCLEWLSWSSNTVHPAYAHLRRPERYTDDPKMHAAIQEKGKQNFTNHLDSINEHLQTHRFALGDEYSIADTYFLVFFCWANTSLNFASIQDRLPNYTDFAKRMLERPAVQKAIQTEGIADRFKF